jgi:hypothetical protein
MKLDRTLLKSTDGYGMPVQPFHLPDPPLRPGWCIVDRHRSEDGEHIWAVRAETGTVFRWLEDEGGPEWAFRQLTQVVLPEG